MPIANCCRREFKASNQPDHMTSFILHLPVPKRAYRVHNGAHWRKSGMGAPVSLIGRWKSCASLSSLRWRIKTGGSKEPDIMQLLFNKFCRIMPCTVRNVCNFNTVVLFGVMFLNSHIWWIMMCASKTFLFRGDSIVWPEAMLVRMALYQIFINTYKKSFR